MANISVRVTTDRSDFDKGMEAVKNSVKGLNNSLQGLGTVGGVLAGVFGGNMITGLISSLFGKLQEKISESRQELIKLGHDAENIGIKPSDLYEVIETFHRFGVEGDQVTSMFGRMASARESALNGNKDMIKSFAALGLGLDDLAKKSPKGLFEAMLSRNAALGGTGDASDAMTKIFGRGMKSPGMQRAALAYGSGRVEQKVIGLSDDSVIAERLAEQRWHSFWQSFKNFMNNPVPGIGGLYIPGAPGMLGVSESDIKAEQDAQQKAEEKRRADNLAAIERAKKRESDHKAAVAAEESRFAEDQKAEREEEIKHGLRMDRPDTDSFTKRGLLAGGGAVNNTAYALGRQQVSLAQQSVEALRKIEAHLAIQTRHKNEVERIKNQYSGMGDDQEVQ